MRRRALVLGLPAVAAGCGYRSARPDAAGARVVVVAGERGAAEAVLIEGAVAGARARLGPQGAIGAGGWPRLRLEVTATGEEAAGVVSRAGAVAARATGLWARGEASLDEGPGATGRWRSGEVTVSAEAARDGALEGELLRRDAALRGLGWRLGEALAARFLGDVAPTLDRM